MSGVSRRDWLRSLIGRRTEFGENHQLPPTAAATTDHAALILDRFCLAYQGSFCTVCSEHCPERGAIRIHQGKPTVVAELCTGCSKCQEVCPAPKNAVFLVAKTPRQGMIGRTVEETRPEEA